MAATDDFTHDSPRAHPEIDVSQLIGFRLWKLAVASGAPIIRLCEGRYGVSRLEWSLLAVVASSGHISPSDLAARAGVVRPTTSKAVRALIDKGLVTRWRTRRSGRRYDIRLTAKGLTLVEALFAEISGYSERLLSSLEPVTRAHFEAALQQLTAYAEELNRTAYPEVKANRGRLPSRH